ncbi:glucose-1-dehydrogenase (plasmid) [Fulvitalea axinellae]|uniref:Glucose-1-dehydrogenase n=1 Tax=Fulvitalea axinellae TaxID=1182444 RepID=A0AAU9CSP8_9BACT|nr:glucose-1-dehydrogenase [Fulvitalea axinellae]
MKPRLDGQVALVTGANSGIGKAVAMAMAKAGAKVGINYVVNEEATQAMIDEIKESGGEAIALKADVSDEGEVKAMFAKLFEAFGTIDILVNNAGLQRDAKFWEMSVGHWKKVIDVNLTGQFLCAREAVNEFIRRGIVESVSTASGKIICMSSVHDVIPWAGHANYAASKGGVKLLMQSMAQELAPYKIRVNSIGPGAIKTPINKDAWNTPEAEESLLTLIPYKRVGEPSDIGKAAVWLASDESDYVNGATLYVDGGMTLYPGFATGG